MTSNRLPAEFIDALPALQPGWVWLVSGGPGDPGLITALGLKALADAEAALANLTSSGQKVKKYQIGTRNAEYYTAPELIAAIRFWRARVLNEKTAQDVANGLGSPRNLHVRFRS